MMLRNCGWYLLTSGSSEVLGPGSEPRLLSVLFLCWSPSAVKATWLPDLRPGPRDAGESCWLRRSTYLSGDSGSTGVPRSGNKSEGLVSCGLQGLALCLQDRKGTAPCRRCISLVVRLGEYFKRLFQKIIYFICAVLVAEQTFWLCEGHILQLLCLGFSIGGFSVRH